MFLLLSFLFLLLHPPTSAARHTITFRTSSPRHLSSLAWDPISQHFVAGSAVSPTVHAISDAGVVEHLLSDPSSAGSAAAASSVAVDHLRRRLVVAFSNPGSVAAYDLKSYNRIFAAPLPELDTVPGGAAVDLRSGEVFVTSSKRGVVWRVGLDGDVKVVSESKGFGTKGLKGAVHVSRGYLLVLQPETGKIFKVDSDDGLSREVFAMGDSDPLAPDGYTIALHADLSIVIATNKSLLLVKSNDSWGRAAVHDKSELQEGETAVAVAIRERKRAYVLVKSEEDGYRIEDVAWDNAAEGDMVWGMVLVGFGLAYFMYWWFLMRKLTTNLNKKRS